MTQRMRSNNMHQEHDTDGGGMSAHMMAYFGKNEALYDDSQ